VLLQPSDIAIAADGSIYVLRRRIVDCFRICEANQSVSRLQSNGALDASFGAGGKSNVFEFAGSIPTVDASSLALTADGGVVVASVDNGRLVLARLKSDGSLDGGFGVGGYVEDDLGAPVGRVRVAVASDGRIVVGAGPGDGYGGETAIVTRYTAQGLPDPEFNGGIPVITNLGSGLGGFGLAGDDGVVLAAPRCCEAFGRAIHLNRFDASGRLESEFGHGGERYVDDVAGGVGIGALVVRPNGSIYVFGSGRRDRKAFILKLRPDGRLASRFGHRGIAYVKRTRLEIVDAALDRAGRILIVGNASGRPTVLRRLPDGRRDRTFAGGRLVQRDFPHRPAEAVAAGLQFGRQLIVLMAEGGECIRGCSSPRAFLVRYYGGTSGVRCQGRRATIVGTRHGEKLMGTRRRDVIAALGGNDLVRGGGGDDLICGGSGDDRLIGGGGRDRISGGPGHNRVQS